MAVERATKRIRPKDFELSQVQDNLGNVLDGVLDTLNKGSFRRTLQLGVFWTSGNGMPTSDTQLVRPLIDKNVNYFQYMTAAEVMPTGGSVLSVQAYANKQPKGTLTFTLYINGKQTALFCQGKTPALYATLPRNKLLYRAGDVLQVYARSTASNEDFAISASVDVESQA